MTTFLTIAILETLAVFGSPIVAIEPTETGYFFVATNQEIFQFHDDSLIAEISYAGDERLSGISDIAYSGLQFIVAVPEKRRLIFFNRNLRFLGTKDLEIRPDRIVLSPLGDIYIFDKIDGSIITYDKVGEFESKCYLRQLVLSFKSRFLGISTADEISDDLLELGILNFLEGSIPEPILWDRENKLLWVGDTLTIPKRFQDLWFTGESMVGLSGDSLIIPNFGVVHINRSVRFVKFFQENFLIGTENLILRPLKPKIPKDSIQNQ